MGLKNLFGQHRDNWDKAARWQYGSLVVFVLGPPVFFYLFAPTPNILSALVFSAMGFGVWTAFMISIVEFLVKIEAIKKSRGEVDYRKKVADRSDRARRLKSRPKRNG
jgi:heme exporter protein D